MGDPHKMSEPEDPLQNYRRQQMMEAALEAVLLYFSADGWDPEKGKRWKVITGADECTSKTLCDFVRKALNREEKQFPEV